MLCGGLNAGAEVAGLLLEPAPNDLNANCTLGGAALFSSFSLASSLGVLLKSSLTNEVRSVSFLVIAGGGTLTWPDVANILEPG